MSKNLVKIIKWQSNKKSKLLDSFCNRDQVDSDADKIASKILNNIKLNGDKALLEAIKKYDSNKLSLNSILVTKSEIENSKKNVDNSFKKSVKEVCKRIKLFANESLKKDWYLKTENNGVVGEKFIPFDRIGAYIPGGEAPLVSTVLMTVYLAKIAGVKEIVACSPAKSDGSLNDFITYALSYAGATEIYKIGGIQAIGAMAYGTKTIKKVRKIVGPGGPYVTAAKRQVYGNVSLDMIAGPSEIAILCDSSGDPKHIAADLLSQAEHGTGYEKSLLITTSDLQAKLIRKEVLNQYKLLSRNESIAKVLEYGMLLVVVKNLSDGVKLVNKFAPEHMELIVKNPKHWVNKIKTAGALFIGPWTPEVVGDFVAGPSHVLPTGGSCHYFSGLTVDDFRRRISIIEYTKKDLEKSLPLIEDFGRVETLDGHTYSAKVRFNK